MPKANTTDCPQCGESNNFSSVDRTNEANVVYTCRCGGSLVVDTTAKSKEKDDKAAAKAERT